MKKSRLTKSQIVAIFTEAELGCTLGVKLIRMKTALGRFLFLDDGIGRCPDAP